MPFLGLGLKTLGMMPPYSSSPQTGTQEVPMAVLTVQMDSLLYKGWNNKVEEPGSLNFCKGHDRLASLACSSCSMSNKKGCSLIHCVGVTVPAAQALYRNRFEHHMQQCPECLTSNDLIQSLEESTVIIPIFQKQKPRYGGRSFSPRPQSGEANTTAHLDGAKFTQLSRDDTDDSVSDTEASSLCSEQSHPN